MNLNFNILNLQKKNNTNYFYILISLVYGIIALTCLISMQAIKQDSLKEKLIFSPYLIKHENQWYRLFSHSWIHADWQHLFFNMVSLYFLGELLLHQWLIDYGVVKGNIIFHYHLF